ncbi:SDR family oxidoreductase [Mycobacterium sp. 236(2023)]|uniref:SDR family oxidoreductase n=1 Tax=Mycobacterium sp. 236(2023) TaxID=3038163 RepID=UPI0024151AD1|nr:SDR family oxidoreductase [Mycobacterium sp. 236(2023)]MDG4667915.1 SDR family NAD(P)-dependent oxidoreductase [Mycobacterium sp. 236(2023)]
MANKRQRVVVVGGSSGLGRSIGVGLAQRGAHVAFLARRRDRLDRAAAEAGHGAVAITCDVTNEESCRAAIARSAEVLGGIDALIYSTAVFLLAPLEEVGEADWSRLMSTNVIGAALVTNAALPHLRHSGGAAVYLSSVSASLTPPWPMAGAYVTSKAALDKLVDAWRAEHPDVGFTRMTVGDSLGGEGDSRSGLPGLLDPEVLAQASTQWMSLGYMNGNLVEVDDVINTVEAVLTCSNAGTFPSLTLAPRATPRALRQ